MRLVTMLLLTAGFQTLLADAAERVVLVAGGSDPNASVAAQAKLLEPFGVDIAADGKMYLVEMTGHRFSVISPQGEFRALAGNGKPGAAGDGGPAGNAQLNGPHALAVSEKGDVYLADTWNHRIRRFEPSTGVLHAFAGTGEKGFGGDGGPAAKAMFGDVYCIAFDSGDRQMLIADLDNRRIRSIDMQTGIVSTVAGNGQKGAPKDGDSATKSPLVDPRAVTVDRQGNIYVLERGGHALRVVDAEGKIRTVAGTGKAGLSGDGGDALQAMLNGPKHLCVDRDGSVLIADSENHVIRRYDPQTGKITRVAGTGKRGSGGLNGPPLEIELDRPHGVYVSREGTLYISDSGNGRVLKIESSP
jgi:sugar lactone lactonase YvrE